MMSKPYVFSIDATSLQSFYHPVLFERYLETSTTGTFILEQHNLEARVSLIDFFYKNLNLNYLLSTYSMGLLIRIFKMNFHH